jgi:hypothetical protein
MTDNTSSTGKFKSYYVCDKDNFNLFCAAALAGMTAHPASLKPQPTAKLAVDYAEALMEEFQKRRAIK